MVRKNVVWLVAVSILLGAMPGLARAASFAIFSGGNGAALVDQYAGIPGNGWSTAWIENADAALNGTVVTSADSGYDPFSAGSGNYLRLTFSNAGSYGAAWRGHNGVDRSKPYTIAWDFRLDSALNGFDISIQDRDSASGISSSASSFIVRANHDNDNTLTAGMWSLYDGIPTDTDFQHFMNTGIAVQQDTTYSFLLTLRPADREYDATISWDGDSQSFYDLGFRTTATTTSPYLGFGADVTAGSGNMIYSIDNIRIIPEPGTMLLALLGLFALPLVRRRAG